MRSPRSIGLDGQSQTDGLPRVKCQAAHLSHDTRRGLRLRLRPEERREEARGGPRGEGPGQEPDHDAFRKTAVRYHPDRNKDEDATRTFAEASEAYSVLSDNGKRHLYDVLGPDKYDDPREVLFYRLNQEAANREIEREYRSEESARQYSDMEGLGFVIFILVIIDFVIPSWVLGPWFYVLNAFLIPAIAVGIYDQFKS